MKMSESKCNFSVQGMCCDGIPFILSSVQCGGTSEEKKNCYKWALVGAQYSSGGI